MLVRGDADEPSPHETLDPGLPRAADRVADRERYAERQHDPEEIHAVDRPDHPVGVEVAAVLAALLHPEVREHPADVRVDEPAECAERALAVAHMRRVRVARLV